MNELRKYATFSIDITEKPVKVNSMFSMGRARIFYMGANPNRTIIEGEAAYNLANSIGGTPIIGLYDYEEEDFTTHGEGQSAYGFVPLEPNAKWVKFNEDGKERTYLEVDVVIWDGRFEEAKCILNGEKSLSMELNPKTLKGTMVNFENHTHFKITNAEFAGITVLGDDVEPCFKDAGFYQAYSSMVNEYAKYKSEMLDKEEGGINHMDNIEDTEVEKTVVETEEIANDLETEVTETEVEETKVAEKATEENVAIEETPAENTEFAEDKKEKTDCAKKEGACSEKKDDEEESDEVCPECGKNPCVCKDACGDKDKKYSALEAELNAEKAKNESLTNELNGALESLKKYSRKEKLEIISKFSTKLIDGDDLIAELTNDVDNLTNESIKAKLGSALVEQFSAEENAEEEKEQPGNFSLNINVNKDLGDSAWDLVKRHKENK